MKPELLSPAGDWPSLRAAVDAGADAVYLGVKGFNMRANAKNFKVSELKKIVDFCHKNKVKVYVALNTIIYEGELKKLDKIIDKIKKAKADAVIAWDFAVIKKALEKKIDVHISTQMSISNSKSLKFFEKLGLIIPKLHKICGGVTTLYYIMPFG